MLSCPIKTSGRWKNLESQLGEKKAFEEYIASNPETEQSSGSIKQGVSELFESNPELANSVYEVLGFENFPEKGTREYRDSEDILELEMMIEELGNQKLRGNFKFQDILVKAVKTKGFTAKYVGWRKYFNVVTDMDTLIGIYGYIKEKEGYTQSEETLNQLLQLIKNHVNEFNISTITPQQKQQAQQAYSNYLDTIFPDSKVKDIVYHGSSEGFKGNNFDKSFISHGRTQGDGIYFSTNRKTVERFAGISESMYNMLTSEEMKDYLKVAIVNTQKLIDGNEVVVQPEQIHILGSKQDIQGFKEFVKTKPAPFASKDVKIPTAESVRSNRNSLAVIRPILDNLQERFGFKYHLVSNQEMADITGLDPKDRTRGYVSKDGVFINRDNLSMEAVFHEYGHVFVEYINIVKPEIVKNLFNELYTTPEGKKALDKVMASKTYRKMGHYNPTSDKFSERGMKEAIVTMIGRLAEQDFVDVFGEEPLPKSIIDRLRSFIAEIGQAVVDLLGFDVRITPKTFNEKTTLADISVIMSLTDMYLDIREEINDTIDMESEYLTESDLNPHAEIFDNIKIFIESRFRKLSNSNLRHQSEHRYRLEKLKESYEEQSTKVKKLSHMINYAFTELYEKDGEGYVRKVQKIIDDINAGQKNMDPELVLTKLMAYKRFSEEFNHLFNEVRDSLMLTITPEQYFREAGEQGSPLWKLEQVLSALRMIKVKHQTHVIPALASILYPFYSQNAGTQAIKNIDKELLSKRTALARIEKDHENKKKDLFTNVIYSTIRRDIETLENQKVRLDPAWGNLVKQLTEANEDISFLDFKTTPAVSSSDPVLATYANMLKNRFEKMRLTLLDNQRKVKKAFDSYRKSTNVSMDNVVKFNEGLFEKIKIFRNGRFVEVLAFVNEVDMTRYSEDKAKMYDERNYLIKIGKKEEADAVMDAFYKTSHTALDPKEVDEMIADGELDVKNGTMSQGEFHDFIAKNMFNSTVFKTVNEAYMGSEMTLDEKYKTLSDELIRIHRQRGNIRYQRAFSEINKQKYKNPNYLILQQDKAKSALHKVLLDQYLGDQELLPKSQRNGYIVPQIRQQDLERFLAKGGIDYLFDEIKDTFTWMENDEALFGMGAENYAQKFLPIYYTQYIDADNTSVDLARSVLLFSKMANKYSELDKIREVTGAMEDIVNERVVRKTTNEGTAILDKFKKSLGVIKPNIKEGKEARVNQAIDSFIKMQVYGELQKTETITIAGKTINLGKLANSLSSWVSKATIGGDFLKAVANLTQAKVMVFIEANAGEFIDRPSFIKGEGMYMGEVIPQVLGQDFGKGLPESFWGRMIEVFGPLQGDWENSYGKTITRSKLLRTLSWDTHFMGIHAGEHYAQVSMMLGMMEFQKVELNGKQIPLIKAYKQNADGSIGIVDGIDPEWAIGGKKMLAFQAKMHGINKRLHGVYNSLDYIDAQRDSIGRLMLLFRKFAPPGFKRRFKRFGINHETGMVDEGFYNTFFDQMIKQRMNIFKVLMNNDADLSPLQKANMRRAITEMTAMMMTGIAASLVGGSDGEDSYGSNFAEYQFTRLNSELMFYINPLDFMRIMSSPSASTTKIEQLARAINYQFFVWDPERLTYQRRQGIWQKGDSKTMAAWLKLLGLTGYNLHPEEAVKILNMTR